MQQKKRFHLNPSKQERKEEGEEDRETNAKSNGNFRLKSLKYKNRAHFFPFGPNVFQYLANLYLNFKVFATRCTSEHYYWAASFASECSNSKTYWFALIKLCSMAHKAIHKVAFWLSFDMRRMMFVFPFQSWILRRTNQIARIVNVKSKQFETQKSFGSKAKQYNIPIKMSWFWFYTEMVG